jgi:hypothetical protein
MNRFDPKKDRSRALTHTVSFHDVPMPRGLAYVIWVVEKHGGGVAVFSADRRDRIIAEHNHAFGTHLHGQQWLIDAHARNPHHFAAANPVDQTSHCYFSDGNHVYKRPPRAKLPWFMLGIDLTDRSKINDPTHFINVAGRLGFEFVRPYPGTSESHHVVLIASPTHRLEALRVIAHR